MSAATKRKHVTREVIEDLILPDEDEFVAKIQCGKGNNLHLVEIPDGSSFLVSMPSKFRKNVWVKRGDFVLCKPIEEGDKVKAEIFHVLYPQNIDYIKEEGKWPREFCEIQETETVDKRGLNSAYNIDENMFPPSESEEEEDDEEEEEEEEKQKEQRTFNPNHTRGVFANNEASLNQES